MTTPRHVLDLIARDGYVAAEWATPDGEHVVTFCYPTRGRVDLDATDFEGRMVREFYAQDARRDLERFLAGEFGATSL